jgi:hypothetical protein
MNITTVLRCRKAVPARLGQARSSEFEGIDIFAAFENLFDSRIQVAKTPTLNVGPPIFARTGVKLNSE